jgi:acid phosphatase
MRFAVAVSLVSVSLLIGCGGNYGGDNGGGGTGGGGGGTPTPSSTLQHEVVVVLENQNYDQVIGSASMPYLNQLAQQYSLATQFYASVHPSIGNYFVMTTGQVVSTSDSFSGTFGGDHVASILTEAGKSWKMYAQSLPSNGYVDGDQYPYVKHHNPFAYFDSVRNDPAQKANIVDVAQLSTDNSANTLPSYAFVVPDNEHNGHDCPDGTSSCPRADRLNAADTWLQSTIAPLLANSTFMANGVVIITFDESDNDNTMGGGRIPVIVIGNKTKSNYTSATTYQFPSLLRFCLKSVGSTDYPADSATAPDMDEFLR